MSGIFEVHVENHFSAAHALRGYTGDCARLHGHNWVIRVYVRCSELDKTGIGIDFRTLNESLREVLQGIDHCNINEVHPFDEINPTAENIARYLFRELSRRIKSDTVKVSKVRVSETPGAGADYWEE